MTQNLVVCGQIWNKSGLQRAKFSHFLVGTGHLWAMLARFF
jgi:hypothetical protein